MFDENSDTPVSAPHERPASSTAPSSESFGEGIDVEPGNSQQADASPQKSPCPQTTTAGNEAEASNDLLGRLPPEIASLLVVSGIIGVVLPGPFGMPLLIAGGVTLWPKTFLPLERWFSRRFPAAHQEGIHQIREFLKNLEKRFPDQKKASPGATGSAP